MWRRPVRAALFAFAVAGASSCGPSEPRRYELRVYTPDFEFRISTEPGRPYAREPMVFRVVARDKKTKEPIERGEGLVFATSRDGTSVFDILVPAPESGTYVARIKFITAGEWALGIQFRQDSTQRLQRGDWRQTVWPERQ